MTIAYHIIAPPGYDDTIAATFQEVDDRFNKWNPHSEVAYFNQAPPHEKIPLSPSLYRLLCLTDQMVQATEGLFDPTVEPLLRHWKEALAQHRTPSDLDTFPFGWQHVHFMETHWWKDCEGIALDLSGIAKGYTVDLLIERVLDPHVFVEWGGEIRAKGHHPSGRPWRVAITGTTLELELNNQAIATSGNYEQAWETADQTFTHILNPSTRSLLPVTSSRSISVLAPTCAEADALATAALLTNETFTERFPAFTFYFFDNKELNPVSDSPIPDPPAARNTLHSADGLVHPKDQS